MSRYRVVGRYVNGRKVRPETNASSVRMSLMLLLKVLSIGIELDAHIKQFKLFVGGG